MQFVNYKSALKGIECQGDLPKQSELVRNTLKIAWPSVVESFLVSLTGFVDTIMVGALGSSAIAAVGLTTQPKFLALSVFFAIATALSSIIARRRGENNRESANKILKTAMVFGLVLTALVTVLFLSIADFMLFLIGSEEQTHEMAKSYYMIIMSGTVFTTTGLFINACQRGAGNTMIAMRTNVTANIVNMTFNYLLIGGNLGFPALGVQGAAIATVIGTMVSCTMSIISVLNKDGFIYLGARKIGFAVKKDLMSILNVGSSAFAEQIFLRVGFFVNVMIIARLGTTGLATNQIAMNFVSVTFSIADGLAIASVALVGRSLGEKRTDLAKLYSVTCQRLGFACACVISLVFMLFGRELFTLFTDEQVILDTGEIIMRIMCVAMFAQVGQVTGMGCLRGAGDTRYTAMVSLASVAVIRPLGTWVFSYPVGLGVVGAWVGFSADQIVRFILSYVRLKKGDWLKIKI